MRFGLAFLLVALCVLYVNAGEYSATITGNLVCSLKKHAVVKRNAQSSNSEDNEYFYSDEDNDSITDAPVTAKTMRRKHKRTTTTAEPTTKATSTTTEKPTTTTSTTTEKPTTTSTTTTEPTTTMFISDFDYSTVSIKLREKDILLPDNDVKEINPSENGHFEINATKRTFPAETANFYMEIRHTCTDDGKQVCYREDITQEFNDKDSVIVDFKELEITNKFSGC